MAIASQFQPSPEAVLTGLYERHSSRIFGFCRRRLRTPQEAEDALQNTFIAAMQALQRGTVPVCETAWLFKIAENACNGIYRSGARRDDRELTDPDNLSRFAGPESSQDSLVGLEAALEAIPENQRRAFVLRELRGLSYTEIAAQLGVTVASVETLIYRARRGLARALESGAGLRGRLAGLLDLGSIAAAVKAWIGGASALKIGATAAVIATVGVSAADLVTNDPRGPAPASEPSIAREVAGNAQHAVATTAPVEAGPAQPRGRTRSDGPELRIGRRPAPTRTHDVEKAPTPTTSPSQQPPSAGPQAPGPGAAPPLASPPPALPTLPASPVEVPRLGEPLPSGLPLPEAPPLPQAPPLPDLPAVSDLVPVPELPQPPTLP